MAVNYGDLPFLEQILFFRSKVNVPTAAWTDLWQADHDAGFMVAGAAKASLLQDLRDAVDKAISQGTTLAEFRKDFDAIIERTGWSYTGGRSWRTRVIYDTNLRTSYAAGRWAQLQQVKDARPFWQYHHSHLDVDPRPSHLAMDGKIFRADDPIWQVWFPPSAWGCTCYVTAHSQRDLERMGKSGPDEAPALEYETVTVGANGPHPRQVRVPKGIDPAFAYAPGATVKPQIERAVADIIQNKLDDSLAAALARFIADVPPAPPPPEAKS